MVGERVRWTGNGETEGKGGGGGRDNEIEAGQSAGF